MAVPPGITFLTRSFLPLLSFGVLVYWAFDGIQRRAALSGTPWVRLAAAVITPPLVYVCRSSFATFKNRRDAAAMGAVMVPAVQESFFSIVRGIRYSIKSGYPGDIYLKWSTEYGNTFILDLFSERQVVTTEPGHIKAVLATQFQDFEKGPFAIAALGSLLGAGVFNSDGDMWKFHRDMSRPFFNRDRISDFDNFERHAVSTISQIRARLREGFPIDFQDVVARFTLDSATGFLFGKDVKSIAAGLPYPAESPLANRPNFVNHPSNLFIKAFSRGMELIAGRVQGGGTWPLVEFWKDNVQPNRAAVDRFIEPVLTKALDRKLKGIETESDEETVSLLDLLVRSTNDAKVIKDELVNVLVAGRDTTASLLTFAMYMMCEHPEMAQRLQAEILEKVGTRRPTYADIRDMKYLRAFLNETLRLYPVVPVNDRTSRTATTLPNQGRAPYFIPKRTRVAYSVFLMHRRTDLWGPDALEFDPDRFLDSRLHKYLTPNPFIFVPFNAGPRICLGQQFAYNESSYYLIRFLQTFSSFSLAIDAQPAEGIPPTNWTEMPGTTKGREKIMLGFHLTLYAKAGLWIRMKEVNEEI
ncbi:cytochrome P450 monooxygenase pc-3 [Armillaria luteobubalina]|uniref:Cytochrome P450 monooxygenase pc-3 n=1 Tax=Armillaria luteobubalina TaxID=153913 RepID=A0AA39QDB3_9AGAR|nr:cytochrome P450 monooxygenase pc-3 [Armillaria luteobubalina]